MINKIIFDWEEDPKTFSLIRSNHKGIVVRIKTCLLEEKISYAVLFLLEPKNKPYLYLPHIKSSIEEAKTYADTVLNSLGCIFTSSKTKLLL